MKDKQLSWWRNSPIHLTIELQPVGLYNPTRLDIIGTDHRGDRYYLGHYSPQTNTFKPAQDTWEQYLKTNSTRIAKMPGCIKPTKNRIRKRKP